MSEEAGLRFGILGPLRATRDGRELDLGSAKQRAVLAVLLLHAGRPVGTAEVVDAVWGDQPPAHGPNVVQKYVAGLRKVLDPDRSPRSPGAVVSRTGAGYLLRVEPGGLDAADFEDLVRRARQARAAGRPAEAADHLAAALALWRGPVLAGVEGRAAAAARARLDEARAGAEEDRAEAELAAGRAAATVPELRRLVAQWPDRERLRGLLMLALHRSGRQAEALAEYSAARRHLAEEHGVEPGADLRAVHAALLADVPVAPLAPAAPPARRITGPDAAPPPAAPPAAPPGGPAGGPPGGPAGVGSTRRSRRWRVAGAVAAALVPLVTVGLATWALVAFFAARRRSGRLAAAAGGYFLLVAFPLVVIDPAAGGGPLIAPAVLAWLLAILGGAAHAAVLALDRPAQAASSTSPPGATSTANVA